MRQLQAMQAMAMDLTLPRRDREGELVSTYQRGQGFRDCRYGRDYWYPRGPCRPERRTCWIFTRSLEEGLASRHIAGRATWSPAALLASTPGARRKDEVDALVDRLCSSGNGFETFVALCALANDMAERVVGSDPALRSKADLLRQEGLAFESSRSDH